MKKVAILGLGIIGKGVADCLVENKEIITKNSGDELELKYALDLREFPNSPYKDKVVHNIATIVEDDEVSLVVETMGGSHPAFEFTKACLEKGKSVVSSNKELVSTYGIELQNIAKANGVSYLFEASVGGAIPLIHPLKEDLGGNDILEMSGIVNGTTNYILTRMFDNGAAFEEALKEAQALGYAEKDPTADVDGIDPSRKIAILVATVTGKLVDSTKLYTEGIRSIRKVDVERAGKENCSIKLLARYIKTNGKEWVFVAPFFVTQVNFLAAIKDVVNGVFIRTNYAGETYLVGRGAGSHPTASSVIDDLIQIVSGKATTQTWEKSECEPFDTFSSKHYVSLIKSDINTIKNILPIESIYVDKDEVVAYTEEMTESEFKAKQEKLQEVGAVIVSHFRIF